MLISTRGRYALRIMADLAERQSEGFVPLKDLARCQEISEKYLESITKLLVKAGLLEGLRGKGGGYRRRTWSRGRRPVPGRRTAAPCPSGRAWTG